MEEKMNYTIKWQRSIELCAAIFFLGFLICITLLALIILNKVLFLILFIVGLVSDILFLIYACIFGFNTTMYIDCEKIYTTIHGKHYEWRWEDINLMEIKWVPIFVAIRKIHIMTDCNYKKLTFEMDQSRYKTLMEICPNESIKAKLKALVETDD